MSIAVEIVVVGAVGELVASMLGELSVERRSDNVVLRSDESSLMSVLDRLTRADVEVVSVVALPTPGG